MKKLYRSMLSILLSVLLCCQLPVTAGEISQLNTELIDLSSYQEDVTRRSANSKHFLLPDGTYSAVVYDASVHYEKDGNWVEIDNSLVSASLVGEPLTGIIKRNNELSALDKKTIAQNAKAFGDIYSTEYYENSSNNFQVNLPKDINSNMPIIIGYKGHTLRFSVNDIDESASQVVQPLDATATAQKLQNALIGVTNEETREQIKREHITSVQKNRSSVKYQSTKPDMDLNYYVAGQSLKEDIVLHSMPTANTFSFDFTYTGLQAIMQQDNRVLFNDASGETIFIIDAPYMFDSGEGYSTDIEVSLVQTSTGCRYTLTPNREWLEDEQRIYPVTLDPSVTTTQNTNYIHDNGVQQSNPNSNYKAYDRIYVGSSTGGQEGRMYFKLTQWPSASILSNYTITSAYLNLRYYPQASWQTAYQTTLDVHMVYNTWDTNTITWNNQTGISSERISGKYISDGRNKTSGYESFDVTAWVKEHYLNPSYDEGIRLQPRAVQQATNRACFISSDYYTNTTLRPTVVIYYTSYLFGLVGITAEKNPEQHDHSSFMNNAVPALFTKSKNMDTTALETLNLLRVSRSFIIRSHGEKTAVACRLTNLTRANILALPSNALSHLQLVFYGACLTGEGGAAAENLVNATYDRGARTVIGFTTEVYCGATNRWTEVFMTYLSNGATIAEAIRQADTSMGSDHGNTICRLVRGPQDVTIVNTV